MRDWNRYVREHLPSLDRVRPEREAAIVEELAQQLESAYTDALAGGASEEAALALANRQVGDWDEFGRKLQDAERTTAVEPIPQNGRMLQGFWQDVRYAARLLRRSPGFACGAILTLALGIGGCTAMFSLLDAIVLRPLDYKDPDRLVAVWEHNLVRGDRENVVSPANYLDWRKRSNVFAQASAVAQTQRSLTGVGDPESVAVELVEAEYFPMLGVAPILGRPFLASEDKPGAPRPVLLSHSIWTRKFSSDPAIAGKSVNLSGTPYEVIGVLPANFLGFGKPADAYTTLQLDPARDYRQGAGRYMTVIGRLRDGVTIEQAQRDLGAVAEQLVRDHPRFNTNWGVNLVPLRKQFSSKVSFGLWILMGAMGLVLAIACANVANLILARSVQREREAAIRAALGASRFRMIRQTLTESVLLALLSGVAGCILAYFVVEAFQRFGPLDVPRLESAGIDLRVLGMTLLIALGAAILSGVAPALVTSRLDLSGGMKDGGRGIAGVKNGALQTIVVVEVALAVMLLAGAGVLLRSFQQLVNVDPGFDASNMLTMSVSLPSTRYPPERALTFFRDVNERIRQMPGVLSASAITFLPFNGMAAATSFTVEGRPEPAAGQSPVTEVRIVQPDYFSTMKIPLRLGRDFNAGDNRQEAPLRFVINETLAKTMFPGQDPLGQRLRVSMQENGPGEIIGVVGDTKHYGLSSPVRPMVYYVQAKLNFGFASLVIRPSQGEPAANLIQPVLRIIHGIDPEQPVSEIRTMEELVNRSVSTQRFLMALLAAFAGLAVLLAVVGIYSVLSFAVSQRTHEIGVRLALGATPSEVRWSVVKRGLAVTGVGLAVGLAGATLTNGMLRQFAFQTEVRDPRTLVAAAVLLAAAAVCASYVPAYRATRVDPLEALRYE
jgi:putative ABC transport system permease protein